MLRMVNLLIALSLGTQRAQLEQRTGLTWPRPFLLRPLLKREKELKSVFQAQKIFFFLDDSILPLSRWVGDSRYRY